MTPDDLLASTASGDLPWSPATVKIRTDLLEGLRRGPVDGIDDLDVAEALALLLHSDFMAYGTGGGERLVDSEARVALRALRATCSRLGVLVSVPWQDFTSFRSYWMAHDGYGSWAARREMVGSALDPVLARLYQLQEQVPAGNVVTPALNALADAAVINEHLRRLMTSVDSDPRLAVSVAKDFVESTAKLVLRERRVQFSPKDDLPALVAQAQQALRLHATGVGDVTEEAKALKTILGSLARLTQGVTELRNQVGVATGDTSRVSPPPSTTASCALTSRRRLMRSRGLMDCSLTIKGGVRPLRTTTTTPRPSAMGTPSAPVQTGGSGNSQQVSQTVTVDQRAQVLGMVGGMLRTLDEAEGDTTEVRSAIEAIKDEATSDVATPDSLKNRVMQAIVIAGATEGGKLVLQGLAHLLGVVTS